MAVPCNFVRAVPRRNLAARGLGAVSRAWTAGLAAYARSGGCRMPKDGQPFQSRQCWQPVGRRWRSLGRQRGPKSTATLRRRDRGRGAGPRCRGRGMPASPQLILQPPIPPTVHGKGSRGGGGNHDARMACKPYRRHTGRLRAQARCILHGPAGARRRACGGLAASHYAGDAPCVTAVAACLCRGIGRDAAAAKHCAARVEVLLQLVGDLDVAVNNSCDIPALAGGACLS